MLSVFSKVGRYRSSVSDVFENVPHFSRRFYRRWELLIELRCVPVDLRQGQDIAGDGQDRAVRVLMLNEQQWPRDAQTRVGSIIRNAAPGVEQALAAKVDEGAAKNGVIAVPKNGDGRALLDPHEVRNLDAKFLQCGINAFRLLWPKPRGLQDNDVCGNMPVVRLVNGDRLGN